MSETVLIVAAHPDDEVLGAGATMARHSAAGDDVHVLILAEGATSRSNSRSQSLETLDALRTAAANAASILGTRPPHFAGLPDNRLDSLDLLDVVKVVESLVADISPTVVYTHHGGDLNIDHGIAHRATLTACRPVPGSSVREIWSFETVSSTEWASTEQNMPFLPNLWIDVAATLTKKCAALDAYRHEMRPFPHARSIEAIEALARLRGSQAGMAAAEAFSLVRARRIDI